LRKFVTYLRLGRVSNLPTVWTNVAAGAALGQATAGFSTLAALAVALSLAYVGGMFLNDAFDREIDAVERPERPIPSGAVSPGEVFAIGFGLLAACVVLVVVVTLENGRPRWSAVASALVLAALVVLYDVRHKQNSFSPVIMGLCRGAVYATAALAAGGALAPPLVVGALSLVAYIVGLTFVARYETAQQFGAWAALLLLGVPAVVALATGAASAWTWAAAALFVGWTAFAVRPLFSPQGRKVPTAVARMIAGVCLLDGMLAASQGRTELALVGPLGLAVTMLSQRAVRGT
jgi:4-hydroxybenzoate polyprenyltransferase